MSSSSPPPQNVRPPITEADLSSLTRLLAYSQDISVQNLASLLSSNVNILFALSPNQTPLTSLASEFSLILPPPHTPLISHFPKRKGPHTIVEVSAPASNVILSKNAKPILFSGIPHSFSPNPLLFPILNAPPESFASDSEGDAGADTVVEAAEKGGEGLWAGSAMSLVSGFQTKTGGRALWAGGVQMFSNEFFTKEEYGNKQFAKDVTSWVFQETNVLRIDEATHRHAGANETDVLPELYTVNDVVEYSARISEWDPHAGKWRPSSSLQDLQLDFTMLDPHVRTALPSSPTSPGVYSTSFRAPDRHGVFKFVLDYRRRGYTFLYNALTVPVVPPRHDGYPRFLSAAWPYYTGAISTSAGFILFVALWLAGGGAEKEGRKGKKAE